MNGEWLNRLPETWQAKWIDPELSFDSEVQQPASVLRKTFTAPHAEEAVLYITAHGIYTAEINGQKIDSAVLMPGTGDYHARLCVQAYDVTSLLKEGENEIRVTLGDGWYRGSVGIDGIRNYYGTDLALLAQIEADGKAIVCSDETWQASQSGPVRENDLMQGEVYDARKEEITDWHNVTVKDFGYDNLNVSGVPVCEQERFEGKIIQTPNGETVIDFSQNLAGFAELKVNAHEGQKIVLRLGETLDENGNFTQKNFDPGDRNKNGIAQKIEYICKEGLNTYKPSFMIAGFRYAKVETDIDLTDAKFTSIAVYSKMKQTGFFECGNEDVNRLFLNSLWSMRSNFCDVPTDCPTRERAGWTGDAAVFAPAAVYLADCLPVYRKWLAECRYAQQDDGLVQNIAPVNNKGGKISAMLQGSAGWGDACIIVPWVLYEAYGDRSILEENYDMMVRWLSFVEKRAASKTRLQNLRNPYKKYLADQGFHFGEWCQPDVDNMQAMKSTMMHGSPEVATAYYYRSADLLAKIADVLGRPGAAEHFREIAENAKQAYRYTCTKDGVIESDRQCEYVRPVSFGLLNEEESKMAADTLNEMVVNNGYHLNTGFLSTPDLTKVLSGYGHTDTAYRLLLQEECPGWLYEVKKGATTIWETWDGVKEDGTVHDSLNHYSYGAVCGWLFDGAAGISLHAGKLQIRPQTDPSLGFVKAKWDSPYGTIESRWKYENQKLIFDIAVPCEAEVILPNGEVHNVTEGNYHYEILL